MSFNFIISSSQKVEEFYNKGVLFSGQANSSFELQSIGSYNIVHNGKSGFDYFQTDTAAILIYGYIRHKTLNWNHNSPNKEFFTCLLSDITTISPVEFKLKYTGVYSIVYVTKDEIKLFSVFSSVHLLYYSTDNLETSVSNNLVSMQNLLGAKMYLPSVIQFLCSNYKEVVGRKTILEKVFRLEPNEYVKLSGNKSESTKMEFNPIYFGSRDINEIAKYVWSNYNNEVKAYCGSGAEVSMCLSGGLDSRLMLISMNEFAKITAINHGEEEFYETKVAKRLADAVKVPFFMTRDTHETFPTSEDLYRHIINGGGAISEYIPIAKLIVDKKLSNKVILGDLFESLDARGTSFMSSRANRIKYVISKIRRKAIVIKQLDDNTFEEWKNEKKRFLLKQFEKGKAYLSTTFLSSIKEIDYKLQLEEDLDAYLDDFKYFKVNNIEDLNEIYGWLTKARLFHCRQLFSFSGMAQAENITCTDDFLARILGIPLEFRVRKRLIYLIANSKQFSRVKNIPTVQVPFVPTNIPLIIREAILYSRYKIDEVLLKKSMKKSGNIRSRVAKAMNTKFEYENPTAYDNTEKWFTGDYVNKKYMLDLFTATKNGKEWPYTNMFFINSAKCELLLRLFFKSENKQE